MTDQTDTPTSQVPSPAAPQSPESASPRRVRVGKAGLALSLLMWGTLLLLFILQPT